jgi:hypothetical protein
MPLDPANWTRIGAAPYAGLGYHGQYHDYSAEIPNTQYPAERYSPSLHLLDVHSWGLTSAPPDFGFGLMSNDKMRLMNLDASVLYNSNEGTAGFATNVSYNRFFPVLDLGFADRDRSLQFSGYKETWTERTASAGFQIPLNFSRGYYVTGLSFGATVESIRLNGGGLTPLVYGLRFSRARQRAPRDLAPLWAQTLRLTYRQTPWTGQYTGNFLSADGRFAVPGLLRHHALVLESGHERQHGSYYFSSQIRFPRGYTPFTGADLTKYSATYEMPLLYPDLALSQLVYVKRVAGNVFYDYGKVGNTLYRSTGVEAVLDLNFLHFPYNFRFGMRYAYRIDLGNKRIQPFVAFNW